MRLIVYFLALFYAISYSSFTHTQENSFQKETREWSNIYLNKLKPHQIQLLGNNLYLLYLQAQYTLEFQDLTIKFTRLVKNTTNKLNPFILKEIATICERLAPLSSKLTITENALAECEQYITNSDTHDTQPVIEILNTIKEAGCIIHINKSEDISKDIHAFNTEVIETIQNTIELLNNTLVVCKNAQNNKQKPRELIIFYILFNALQKTTIGAWELIDMNTDIIEGHCLFVEQSMLIFYAYYMEVYDYIQQNDMPQKYRSLLFPLPKNENTIHEQKLLPKLPRLDI